MQQDSEVSEALERALQEGNYQTELPLDRSFEFSPGDANGDFEFWMILGKIIFYGLVASAVVAFITIIWMAVRSLVVRRRHQVDPVVEKKPTYLRVGDEGLDIDLSDATAQAEAGIYSAAIHTVFLETLRALSRLTGARLERHFTSREIVARIPLAENAQHALGALVGVVEFTHFGGREAGRDDYEGALERHHAFVRALQEPAS